MIPVTRMANEDAVLREKLLSFDIPRCEAAIQRLKRLADESAHELICEFLALTKGRDPDSRLSFRAARALGENAPMSFFTRKLCCDGGACKNDWHRYWIAMALRYSKDPECTVLIVALMSGTTNLSLMEGLTDALVQHETRMSSEDRLAAARAASVGLKKLPSVDNFAGYQLKAIKKWK